MDRDRNYMLNGPWTGSALKSNPPRSLGNPLSRHGWLCVVLTAILLVSAILVALSHIAPGKDLP